LEVLRHRLQIEEATEAALRQVEAQHRSELAVSARGDNGDFVSKDGLIAVVHSRLREQNVQSVELAHRSAQELGLELGMVRNELNVPSDPTPRPSAILASAPPLGDLEAAGLQRNLGSVFAAEWRTLCQLKEAMLQLHFSQDINSTIMGHLAMQRPSGRSDNTALRWPWPQAGHTLDHRGGDYEAFGVGSTAAEPRARSRSMDLDRLREQLKELCEQLDIKASRD